MLISLVFLAILGVVDGRQIVESSTLHDQVQILAEVTEALQRNLLLLFLLVLVNVLTLSGAFSWMKRSYRNIISTSPSSYTPSADNVPASELPVTNATEGDNADVDFDGVPNYPPPPFTPSPTFDDLYNRFMDAQRIRAIHRNADRNELQNIFGRARELSENRTSLFGNASVSTSAPIPTVIPPLCNGQSSLAPSSCNVPSPFGSRTNSAGSTPTFTLFGTQPSSSRNPQVFGSGTSIFGSNCGSSTVSTSSAPGLSPPSTGSSFFGSTTNPMSVSSSWLFNPTPIPDVPAFNVLASSSNSFGSFSNWRSTNAFATSNAPSFGVTNSSPDSAGTTSCNGISPLFSSTTGSSSLSGSAIVPPAVSAATSHSCSASSNSIFGAPVKNNATLPKADNSETLTQGRSRAFTLPPSLFGSDSAARNSATSSVSTFTTQRFGGTSSSLPNKTVSVTAASEQNRTDLPCAFGLPRIEEETSPRASGFRSSREEFTQSSTTRPTHTETNDARASSSETSNDGAALTK